MRKPVIGTPAGPARSTARRFRRRQTPGVVAVVVGAALLLTGCANGASAGSTPPTADAGTELIGQGTVIQVGDADPELCLGAIAQSYPPQCGGPTVLGWDWASATQSETVSNVTWGTYAVFGTWDGTSLTTTKPPIPLSLYDAMPIEDARRDGSRPGNTEQAELESIQAELQLPNDVEALGSYIDHGYLFVDVIFDNGTVQALLDERYGPDVVILQPALRPAP
ncbi:hypothetical protein E3T55_03100 [Cryobacterium frigoriphilum]|uniref:Uncharacterized protein n=1 Tax=Cryobacterium frigoriphilum TaxID=1259150 RepID=A0A4R9A9K7_9MICO|nr:hypothetical protein [Cryobacterium frigoriphilum]TFD54438.1 hypothetical protein E3T55_03100 [Cryobacterium frigoriphilum]